ncbi:MAG TPA: DUF3598 family protein [Actinomycetota bacterium]|nr:DUF3598 family protein [Actinomycetota bacterium]
MQTTNIRQEMPLLARHEGIWEGTYTFVDREAKVIDRHASRLTCSFPEDPSTPYHQTNEYTWEDGRTERIEFPATYADGRLHFDTERIDGVCWEVDDHCIVLHWVYKADRSVTLYELIHLDDSGNNRSRTWHWFKDGVCFQRTLIDEHRVS